MPNLQPATAQYKVSPISAREDTEERRIVTCRLAAYNLELLRSSPKSPVFTPNIYVWFILIISSDWRYSNFCSTEIWGTGLNQFLVWTWRIPISWGSFCS